MAGDDGWASPSEIAEYVYCPRSHWYRRNPPAGGPSLPSQRRARDGVRYHERVLAAEQRREERGGAYWVALLFGLLLAVAGIAWVLHP